MIEAARRHGVAVFLVTDAASKSEHGETRNAIHVARMDEATGQVLLYQVNVSPSEEFTPSPLAWLAYPAGALDCVVTPTLFVAAVPASIVVMTGVWIGFATGMIEPGDIALP